MRPEKLQIRLLRAALVLLAAGFSQALFAAENPIYKVGSWVSYKMNSKMENMPGAAGAGGAGAMGAGGMGMLDPKMLAMLPPEKRAKIEAQMQQQQEAMKKQQAGMKASGAGDANNMMKDMDFKMKLSVVGEEKRDGKDCLWLEMYVSGKLPDMDKMMEGFSSQLASLPPEKQAEVKANLEKSKKKMEKMPMRTKDGRIKMVMKILVEKPDPNAAVTLNPIEIWKQQGDNPVVKLSVADTAKFGKGESESSHKSKSETKQEFGMHSETNVHANLMSDEKRAQVEETADKVGQSAKMARNVAAIIPGGQVAAAGLGVLGEVMDATKDVSNIGLDVKVNVDMKAKVETKSEQETHTATNLISQESKVLGAEDVALPNGDTIKAVHTQALAIRERVQTTKAKTETKMDMKMKMDMKVGVGVDGGAQSKTGKVLGAVGGGVGKTVGFLRDPLGLKKKQADEQQEQTQKAITDAATNNGKGIETDVETKTRQEETKDYWISPAIPAFGLAKMASATQDKEDQTNTTMSGGMYGDGSNPMAMNPMAGMMGGMRGGMPKPAKPKMIMETVIDQMGTTGAKSQLD